MEEGSPPKDEGERIFYNILLRVGALGKYQYVSLFIWSMTHLVNASVLFFNPFLFYQADYECPGLTESQCKSMVCSLPQGLRGQYIPSYAPTLIDEYGDFRCQGSSQINYIQSIIYLAGVIGAFLGTYINIYIRKKLIFQATIVLSLICFIILLFFKGSLTLLTILLSANYTFQVINSDLLTCFITETVIQQHRGNHIMVAFITFNLGSVMNGILFKFFAWKTVFIFYFIIPFFLLFLGLIFYVKETPFDLITLFSAERAYEDLHWIAVQNGKAEDHQITVKELEGMRKEYEESLKEKQKDNVHLLDLVRFKSLRVNSICCCILFFFIYYNYTSPILALNQFSTDIYTNAIFFNLAALLGAWYCYYAIQSYRRKPMIINSSIASLIFIIPLYFTSQCEGECSVSNIIQTGGIFIFRILVEIMFETYYLVQNEIFPTQIRSLAIMVLAASASFAPVFVPLANEVNESFNFFLPCTYIVSGIIIVISTGILPETLGVPPPEIIEQLEYKYKAVSA